MFTTEKRCPVCGRAAELDRQGKLAIHAPGPGKGGPVVCAGSGERPRVKAKIVKA